MICRTLWLVLVWILVRFLRWREHACLAVRFDHHERSIRISEHSRAVPHSANVRRMTLRARVWTRPPPKRIEVLLSRKTIRVFCAIWILVRIAIGIVHGVFRPRRNRRYRLRLLL